MIATRNCHENVNNLCVILHVHDYLQLRRKLSSERLKVKWRSLALPVSDQNCVKLFRDALLSLTSLSGYGFSLYLQCIVVPVEASQWVVSINRVDNHVLPFDFCKVNDSVWENQALLPGRPRLTSTISLQLLRFWKLNSRKENVCVIFFSIHFCQNCCCVVGDQRLVFAVLEMVFS